MVEDHVCLGSNPSRAIMGEEEERIRPDVAFSIEKMKGAKELGFICRGCGEEMYSVGFVLNEEKEPGDDRFFEEVCDECGESDIENLLTTDIKEISEIIASHDEWITYSDLRSKFSKSTYRLDRAINHCLIHSHYYSLYVVFEGGEPQFEAGEDGLK